MSETRIEVLCNRTECMFHVNKPGDSTYVWCMHPDKEHFLKPRPCPLFQLDFRRQARAGNGSPQDFLRLIRKR